MLISTPRDWGNVVRDRRIDLGLTQAELAERVGMTRQWILRFESGHAGSASLASLNRVLLALGLDVDVRSADDAEDSDVVYPIDDEDHKVLR